MRIATLRIFLSLFHVNYLQEMGNRISCIAFRFVYSYKLHVLLFLRSPPTHHIHVRLHERELENGTASHPIADRRGLGWGRGGSGATPLLRHIDSA